MIRTTPSLLAGACTSLLAACGGGGGDDGPPALAQYTTAPAAASITPIATSGEWMVFFADEATSGVGGTDFNGDGDKNDAIPVAVNGPTQEESNLLVAAFQAAWAGTNLYLVVDEVLDGRDWDGDANAQSLVLMHWDSAGVLTYLVTLERRGSQHVVSTGDSVFFAVAEVPAGPGASNLQVVSSAEPKSPRAVATTDATGPLRPTLLGADEGLVFLGLDETVETRDLNGDTDTTDTQVLALLNGVAAVEAAGYTASLASTARATTAQSPPFRARRTAPDATDWVVGFLVSEADQGPTNFNTITGGDLPPSWVPGHCGTADTDTEDLVLFFLRWAAWNANPGASPPVNTGLVGDDRVLVVQDYVGTVSPESDQGQGEFFGEPCDLNMDGDLEDTIFRWTRAVTPVQPPNTVALLFPVGDVPGGTRGASELGTRWFIAFSEAQDRTDINGDGAQDLDVMAWLDPASADGWGFNNGSQQNPSVAAATWLGELDGGELVGVAFSERGNDVDLNGDGDALDSVATFVEYEPTLGRPAYPGFAVACQKNNAGIVVQQGLGFYRVSESEDGRDWSGDGAIDDFLLWRSRLSDGQTVAMNILNQLTRLAVDENLAAARIGVFLIDEAQAGDVNLDGRADGLVVAYFNL